MEVWVPYEKIRNHPADFRVKYRLYSVEEGGRKNRVFQGLRCDFSYDGDNMAGSRRLGQVEVIEILGLNANAETLS